MNTHPTVVSEIVAADLCIGCGVCAAVCPSRILDMDWAENGDLVPQLTGDCPPSCNLCLVVCPFESSAQNEDEIARKAFGEEPDIAHHPTLGLHLGTYIGAVQQDSDRVRSSSGGVLTWMLAKLVEEGEIDAVVHVHSGESSDELFRLTISETVDDIRQGAKSRYYPVHLGDALGIVQRLREDKRYAVVTLPCAAKGLRLAMAKLPRLRRRIRFIFTLVCGHLPNRYYTEYLTTLSGIDPRETVTVDFRQKEGTVTANRFHFQAWSKEDAGQSLKFAGDVGAAWRYDQFKHNACNYCDDIFGEVSDACFGDAWLPEYIKDTRGTSIVTVRTKAIADVLERGALNGELLLKSVEADHIAESQKALVRIKRTHLSARLWKAEQEGRKVPPKRVSPDASVYSEYRRFLEAKRRIQTFSKRHWSRHRGRFLLYYRLRTRLMAWPFYVERWRMRFHKARHNPWFALRVLPSPLRAMLKRSLRARI